MPRSSLGRALRRFAMVLVLAMAFIEASEASNLGIRLGLWHLTKPDFTNEPGLEVNNNRNYFYAEASLENGLGRFATFDVTFGTIFRGTTRFRSQSTGDIFLGTANVLPVSLGLTLYPLPVGKVRPYVKAGGTVAIGNQSSNVVRLDISGNPVFDSKTRFTAGGYVSAGLSHRIMTKLNLLTEFSYHHLDFSGPVAGFSNHSGYKILIGLGINYK